MYGVIKTNNFDFEDIELNVFDTEEEAVEFLENDWQQYYNIELEESMIPVLKEQCYHEDDFAKVEWENGDQTYWNLIFAYKHKQKNEETKPEVIGSNCKIELISKKTGMPHSLSNIFKDEIMLRETIYECEPKVSDIVKKLIKLFPEKPYYGSKQIGNDYFRIATRDGFGNEYYLIVKKDSYK